MFNFANPKAARRWEEVHEKAEKHRDDPPPAKLAAKAVEVLAQVKHAAESSQPAAQAALSPERAVPVGGDSPPITSPQRVSVPAPVKASEWEADEAPVDPSAAAAALAASRQRRLDKQRQQQQQPPARSQSPVAPPAYEPPSRASTAAAASPPVAPSPIDPGYERAAAPPPPAAPSVAASRGGAAPSAQAQGDARAAAALKELMAREITKFTPAVESAVTQLRRLSLTIGGARELRVGADGRIRPDGGGAGGVPNIKVRPYVSVFVVGKSGRRLEAPGLALESGLPKAHLSASDAAPVWNESFQMSFSPEALSQASALVLVLMDGGQRGLFGTSSALLGARHDVPLAQARVEFVELAAANMVERESELPLLDESGRRTGATLTVRTEFVDLVACRREAGSLKGRLGQTREAVDGVRATRRVAELRVQREASLLQSEMELDARQAASADAARVMREMQSQLMGFIEAEETLCSNAEGEMRAELDASLAQVYSACDETVATLATEKAFYPTHAPELHSLAHMLNAQQRDVFVAGAQQDSLRLIRIASDGMASILKACEARLHQATDYQIVLHKEATERAREATGEWVSMPAAMVKEELAHQIATWQMRQQGLRAESLAAAGALHAVLVEIQVAHDEEGVRMRARQQWVRESVDAIGAAFIDDVAATTGSYEEEHEARIVEIDHETSALIEASEAHGAARIDDARASLARVEVLIGEVEEESEHEMGICDALAEKEEASRVALLEEIYGRRLQRRCTWIAETEEDARQLAEAAAEEAEEARLGDARLVDERGAISMVEARSRDLFDRARVEHITNVARLHDEATPVFEQRQAAYEHEMHALRDELFHLSTAAVSEHITTVRRHMGEVMTRASELRAASRVKQLEVGTQLLVLHIEQLSHASDANASRMHHAYVEAMHSIRLQHAQIGTGMEVALLRERHTQHLTFHGVFAAAADASWARERAQLAGEVHALNAGRQQMAEKVVSLAEQQTIRHYQSLAAMHEAWAEDEAAHAAQLSAVDSATEMSRAEEPARTRAAQVASQRKVLASAAELMAADAGWFCARHEEAAAAGAERLTHELDVAEELVHEATMEWRKQVREGHETDTRQHHERLLEGERRAHAEAIERASAATVRMMALRDKCATVLDSSQYRAELRQRQLASARQTAKTLAERTSEKLRSGHEALEEALETTRTKVAAVAARANEGMLTRQREVDAAIVGASTQHTVLVLGAGRLRHDAVLKAYDDRQAKRHVALAEVRVGSVRAQEAQLRSQVESEEELGAHVAQVVAAARTKHDAAVEVEKASMEELWAGWHARDATMSGEVAERALGWQKKANHRFVHQLAETWGRQRIHHANLCRETQRARRLAFEQRRAKRKGAVAQLDEQFAAEQQECEEAATGARLALRDAVGDIGEHVGAAAQRVLDVLAAKRIRSATTLMQERYSHAVADEEAVITHVQQLLKRGADETALRIAELSASSTRALGPPPGDFCRHAVEHALGSDDIHDAIQWTGFWEAEELAVMRDGLNRAIIDGLGEKRARAREAAIETATRGAQREVEARQKADEEELKAMAEEEQRLMSATLEDMQTAAKERQQQCELEWQARSIGASAADASRLQSDAVVHRQVLGVERSAKEGFDAGTAAFEAQASKLSPALAAAAAAKGSGLDGAHALMVISAAARAKSTVQKSELAESREATVLFDETESATHGRQTSELSKVVSETRVRREAQLRREIERAGSQLGEKLNMLGAGQLSRVLDDLSERANRVTDRAELEGCTQQRTLLDRHRREPHDIVGGGGSAKAVELQRARSRLDTALLEADKRLREAELAARLAAETPLQRQMRHEMTKHVHKLSGLFAATDTDGDGAVTCDEFRAVLPVIAVEGATVDDADNLFFLITRGAKEIRYRDLFMELTRKPPAPLPMPPAPPPPPAEHVPSARPSVRPTAGSPTPPRRGSKATPRAASAAKERPAAPGASTPKGPDKKAAPVKKGAKGSTRAASAPKTRVAGTPLGQ